jgi:tRNA(fMet)-specific endonuclease VapC
MQYLLDTSICVELIRREPDHLFAKLRSLLPGGAGVSSITLAELRYGAAKSRDPAANRLMLVQFLAPLRVSSFGRRAASVYGQVRADLERIGQPIGPLDTLIAAHALSLNLTLVTNNEREFRRVRGLRVENWLTT